MIDFKRINQLRLFLSGKDKPQKKELTSEKLKKVQAGMILQDAKEEILQDFKELLK